ncbi:MAG: hypothetical protein KGO96_00765 [Elusimicrobia bacterium]|nr:hypothetical protein [Elusimicrobiota bacterium]MDE2424426.1 hypothetical protein [Elusimicrobiota bacterium]
MVREQQYSVFEAINNKRKEIFVGITSRQICETITRIQAYRPSAIKHWNLDDVVNVHSIEFGLSKAQADALLEQYPKKNPQPGWRYLTGIVSEPRE